MEGSSVNKFEYMFRNEVYSKVEFSYVTNKVEVENYTDDFIFTPFGKVINPTIKDLERFFESRCFPKERADCKQLLRDLEVDFYDPKTIVERTHGVQLEDYCWIKFEGEDLDYERDIKRRD